MGGSDPLFGVHPREAQQQQHAPAAAMQHAPPHMHRAQQYPQMVRRALQRVVKLACTELSALSGSAGKVIRRRRRCCIPWSDYGRRGSCGIAWTGQEPSASAILRSPCN